MKESAAINWLQEKAIETIQRAKENGYTVLKLTGFQLGKLPKELFELEQLESLDISYNNLKEIPKEIAQLRNLKHLDISGNGLENLPQEISELVNLEDLYMYDNNFRTLPDVILSLKNLKYLKAQQCQIESLPENIHWLTNLECLVLYKNQLKELPDSFSDLPRLRLCYLEENPFIKDIENKKPRNNYLVLFNYDKTSHEAPKDVTALPSAVIPTHEIINEARIVILGLPGAGKTTLCRKILDGNSVFKHPGSTEGIDIHRWTFEVTPEGIPLIANVWDFGGQEKYESYHPFFLTDEHTVYLVVANGVEENKDNLYKWLELVSKCAASSPLMVVISKSDERRWENLDEEELRKRFPKIGQTEILRVSSKTGENVDNLRRNIITSIKKLSGFGQKSPLEKNWRLVYNQLNELRKTMSQINASDFDNLCKQVGITDIEQRNAIGRYLHNIGAVLYYVDNIRLNHIMVLDMKWAVNGIYQVLDSKTLTENNGRFNQRDAVEVWKKTKNGEEFPSGTHGYLIELLKNFQFCYELQQGEYIVPDKISLKKPRFDFTMNPPLLRARLKSSDRFPQGLITRLMVKCGNMIEWKHTWQKGMTLLYGDSIAIIELTQQNLIEVTIARKNQIEEGKDRFAFFQLIKNELYFVCREFGLRDEKLNWLIPCNCLEVDCEELCYFEEKKLFQRARLGKSIDCHTKETEVSVKPILASVHSHFEDSWELTAKGLKRDMEELFTTLKKCPDYNEEEHLREFSIFTSRENIGEAGKIRQHMINYYVNAN
ncbi:MAG: COR domain-containing protein, partial [Flammeovirgaceae bacterium]|nr:COR domain-containing protein [Flammeovirgaceae bacterium]